MVPGDLSEVDVELDNLGPNEAVPLLSPKQDVAFREVSGGSGAGPKMMIPLSPGSSPDIQREDSGAHDVVALGEEEGQVITDEEKRKMMTYDNVLKLVTEADYFRNKGKIVFTRAFMGMIALRHVQYEVPLEKMPVLRQALLQALENLCGEMWSISHENVWGTTFDKAV
eukprot:Cvel_25953.t3-p1 / transcript=Cvel_25953.t3 / gene=Cvel_25953 / organism=Chromera_velia_CCMP2878 / gene_product=hypothetical protein / transcript_product=hypothetical protein / location=Cvel_scaffold3008:4900-7006(+) / protein_length=168 / sequence_SO=supercontig / SO=protein_coding / is_pseudo=false